MGLVAAETLHITNGDAVRAAEWLWDGVDRIVTAVG